MTVAAGVAKAGPYTGNDAASSFAFAFKVFGDSDLRVVGTDIATGVESDFILNTDYTVARNADQDTSPGGSVTYKVGGVTTALPSTLKLTIVGDFEYEQPTDIPTGGAFFASVVETALDRLTLLIKQLKELSTRTVVAGVSSTATLELPAPTASNLLGWNAAGDALVNYTAMEGAIQVSGFAETLLDDTSAAEARTTLGAVGLTGNEPVAGIKAFTGANTHAGAEVFNGGADIKNLVNGICEGRLTLTSGVPVTTSNVTGATTVYFTPYKGNRIALYDGVSTWSLYTFTEKSLALGTITAGKPYDVFIYDNAGTLTLEMLVWTNDTTRATALVSQDGVLVKSGATTRRYLGKFYTTSTTQTEDSYANRYLSNHHNPVLRPMSAVDATASWTYNTATWREANNSTVNRINFLQGEYFPAVRATATALQANSTGNQTGAIGIGLDATTAVSSQMMVLGIGDAGNYTVGVASYVGTPATGKHYLARLENGMGSGGTVAWYGTQSASVISGISGEVMA